MEEIFRIACEDREWLRVAAVRQIGRAEEQVRARSIAANGAHARYLALVGKLYFPITAETIGAVINSDTLKGITDCATEGPGGRPGFDSVGAVQIHVDG